ncbi:MAG: hypothetical protein JWQ06_1593, partial [Mucilaginibacter sp.]|nr:hypothetical protein [Mucilaginibacter sp.]
YYHMKKKLLLLFTLLFSVCAMAQDFPYGQLSLEELNIKRYDKDTSAHAVVLNEFGDARINNDGDNNIKLYFTYHIKIKILDNKGFDKGNVEIPIYTGDGNDFENVTGIKGTTYYMGDNGSAQQADLDTKKVYTVKQDKHWSTIKFALTNIHEGCVVEYSYQLESPYFLDNFRHWQFQDDIPKVYSEYDVHIPAFFSYKASLRGVLKLTKNVSEVEQDCFSVRGSKSGCSKIIYGMSDIPAFIEEDYMTSTKNFLSAIYFELDDYTNPYTGFKKVITKEWKDIDQHLKQSDEFGSQLKKKDLLKDYIKEAIAGKTDELSKAKAIYSYLQKWFKWNDYIGIYSNDGIRQALNAHTGSIADINFSLIAALNSAGINTEAVLLSTRNHGVINSLYPGTGDFNYVIAKANIDGKSYMLDASDKFLAFGMLPLKCLNDRGRVFSFDKPSYWIDLNATTQRQDDTYSFEFTLQDNGKIKGTIIHYSIGYQSYLKRKEINKFNSTDEYVENLDERLPKLKILKSEIMGLDSLNVPISEKYEVEIDAYGNMNHDKLTFDPYFLSKTIVNPFKLIYRDYPVDWGMPSSSRYIMTMHLPPGYTVDTAPQNYAIGLPNNGGRFIINYQGGENEFTLSHVTQFTKSIYNTDEYPYLKELYNKIIQAEKNEIVFKKKS